VKKTLIIFFLLFFPIILYSEDIYTSSLSIKKVSADIVEISWRSNVKQWDFRIYRSQVGPINSPEALEKATLLAVVDSKGEPFRNHFRYPPFRNRLLESGNYYYAVLPYKVFYTLEDFLPAINFNTEPFYIDINQPPEIKIDEPKPKVVEPVDITEPIKEPVPVKEDVVTVERPTPIETKPEAVETKPEVRVEPRPKPRPVRIQPTVIEPEPYYVSGVFTQRDEDSFLVFWRLNRLTDTDKVFSVYRTNFPVTNFSQIKDISPFRKYTNEYYFADSDIYYGQNYFYTVLLDDGENEIRPGFNSSVKPVIFGAPREVTVERFIIRETATGITPSSVPQIPLRYRDTGLIFDDFKTEVKKPVVEEKKREEPPQIKEKTEVVEREREKDLPVIIKPVPEFIPEPVTEKKIVDTPVHIEREPVIEKPEPDITSKVDKKKEREWKKVSERFVTPDTAKKQSDTQKKVVSERFISQTELEKEKLKIQPAKPENLKKDMLEKGVELFQQKDFLKAIEVLKQSDNPQRLFYIGRAYYSLGNYREALRYFNAYSRVNPNTAKLWIDLTLNRIGESQ
jgi:tetratricopeptide (TPR) repeat protein